MKRWGKLGLAVAAVCHFAGAFAHPGGGIVVLDDGAAIVGDPVNNRVWRFEASKPPVGLVERFHCHWLTLGRDGALYIEALQESGGAWPSSVFRLRRGDAPLEVVGRDELGAHVFLVDEKGRLVFQRGAAIVQRESAGEFAPFRGAGTVARGEPHLGLVLAMAWAPDGALYVADGDRIRVAERDGKLRTRVRFERPAGKTNPWNTGTTPQIIGLSVGAKSTIYVASPQLRSVLRLDRDAAEPRLVTEYAGDGWLPTGVAWKDGSIWVLEHHERLEYGPRVRRIDADGSSTILGVVDEGALLALLLGTFSKTAFQGQERGR